MLRITGKSLRVGPRMMASGSGGGGDGPPTKPHIMRRIWNWLKSLWRK